MNIIEKFKTSFHFSGYRASYLQSCKDDVSKAIIELDWLEHCKHKNIQEKMEAEERLCKVTEETEIKKESIKLSFLNSSIERLEQDIISKTVEIVKKIEKLEWLKTL